MLKLNESQAGTSTPRSLSQASSINDSPLLEPLPLSSSERCCPCLQTIAQTHVGRAVASPAGKAVIGPLIAVGLGTDHMGDTGKVVALASACIWLVSTVLSASNRPRWDALDKHLAQSLGYGIAGWFLVPFGVCTSWLCPPDAPLSQTEFGK